MKATSTDHRLHTSIDIVELTLKGLFIIQTTILTLSKARLKGNEKKAFHFLAKSLMSFEKRQKIDPDPL